MLSVVGARQKYRKSRRTEDTKLGDACDIRNRALTKAAVMGKRHGLRGLKESAIFGRLILDGTGAAFHRACKEKKVWRAEER